MSIEPTDLDWLALCLVTESNRPAEWPYIAQVIENRRKTGRWGHTCQSVVTARMQFSAFNAFTAGGNPSYVGSAAMFDTMARREAPVLLMRAAAMVAEETFASESPDGNIPAQTFSLVISAATLHYYSPVSMKPPGSKPAWAASAKRLYTPSAIDPSRFVFAEAVA